jgi:hypothetical protein
LREKWGGGEDSLVHCGVLKRERKNMKTNQSLKVVECSREVPVCDQSLSLFCELFWGESNSGQVLGELCCGVVGWSGLDVEAVSEHVVYM